MNKFKRTAAMLLAVMMVFVSMSLIFNAQELDSENYPAHDLELAHPVVQAPELTATVTETLLPSHETEPGSPTHKIEQGEFVVMLGGGVISFPVNSEGYLVLSELSNDEVSSFYAETHQEASQPTIGIFYRGITVYFSEDQASDFTEEELYQIGRAMAVAVLDFRPIMQVVKLAFNYALSNGMRIPTDAVSQTFCSHPVWEIHQVHEITGWSDPSRCNGRVEIWTITFRCAICNQTLGTENVHINPLHNFRNMQMGFPCCRHCEFCFISGPSACAWFLPANQCTERCTHCNRSGTTRPCIPLHVGWGMYRCARCGAPIIGIFSDPNDFDTYKDYEPVMPS